MWTSSVLCCYVNLLSSLLLWEPPQFSVAMWTSSVLCCYVNLLSSLLLCEPPQFSVAMWTYSALCCYVSLVTFLLLCEPPQFSVAMWASSVLCCYESLLTFLLLCEPAQFMLLGDPLLLSNPPQAVLCTSSVGELTVWPVCSPCTYTLVSIARQPLAHFTIRTGILLAWVVLLWNQNVSIHSHKFIIIEGGK